LIRERRADVDRGKRLAILSVVLVLAAPAGAGQASAQTKPASAGATHYVIGKAYQFDGVWYEPAVDYGYDVSGVASIYPARSTGLSTTSGEAYDENAIAAAHKTLPLPSLVRITNLDNGKSIKVRVNDRGPFVDDRIIELTPAAALLLGIANPGTAHVRIQIMAQESQALAASLPAGAAAVAGGSFATPAPAPVVKVVSLPLLSGPAVQPLRPVAAPAPTAATAIAPAPAAPPAPVPAASTAPTPAPTTTAATAPPASPTAAQAEPATAEIPLPVPLNPPPPTPAGTAAVWSAVTNTGASATAPSVSPPPAIAAAPPSAPILVSTPVPASGQSVASAAQAPAGGSVAAAGTAPAAAQGITYKPLPLDLPAQFFIQTGAFKAPAEADPVRSKLAGMGPTRLVPTKLGTSQFSAILLGPIASMAEAQRLLKQIGAMGYSDAVLVIQ
jgi:rare lipoprotein A